jgi:hypothetical protein
MSYPTFWGTPGNKPPRAYAAEVFEFVRKADDRSLGRPVREWAMEEARKKLEEVPEHLRDWVKLYVDDWRVREKNRKLASLDF